MFPVTILAISGVGAVVQEATSPIAYASRHHPDWFWRGVSA